MCSKNTIRVIALGFIAISLALAWIEFRSARQAEASIAETVKRRMSLDASVAAARDRLAALARSETELGAALKETRAHEATAALEQKAVHRPELATLIGTNPEVRHLFEESFRASLARRFLPLYRKLGLSGAQIEKFEDLSMDKEEEEMDLQATEQAHGLADTDSAISALRQQQDGAYQAALTELLGISGAQQLQQFDQISPLETEVDQALGPLTGSQRDQLLTVLAHASSSYQVGGNADAQTIDWPTALAQAKNFLSETQMTDLKINSAENRQVLGLVQQFFRLQASTK